MRMLNVVVIVKGELPGVTKQSGLFQDGLGHPKTPLSDGASYRKLIASQLKERADPFILVWFAALYGINPIGMKALGNPATAPILQKLAWDLLQKEPLRGTVATKG
jgi:hypothetical protein